MSTPEQHLIEMAHARQLAERLEREALEAADAARETAVAERRETMTDPQAFALAWLAGNAANRIIRCEAKLETARGDAELREKLWTLQQVYPGVTVERALAFLDGKFSESAAAASRVAPPGPAPCAQSPQGRAGAPLEPRASRK